MAIDKKAISYAAFLALLLIATAALLWWISSVFVELDQSTLAVFLAALLAFSGNWYSQYAISVRSVKEGHREQKVKVYTECIASFVKVHDFIKKEPTANLHDQKWFLCEMAAVNENLLLWGSSDAIISWRAYTNIADNNEEPAIIALKGVDGFLRAMRDDLGFSNRGLGENELAILLASGPTKAR
tara:strand:+ start:146 stop:700 length:555 start_codon:yes stop_codon:yes gene_type:complete